MAHRKTRVQFLSGIRRHGARLLLVALASTLVAGCSGYFWSAPKVWAFKAQLASVPESAPHGTLVLRRNNKHVYLLVDDKAAFRSVEGMEASFRLSPGRHKVVARYVATEGNNAVVAGPIEHSFELAAGGSYALGAAYTGSGIRFLR